jgi:hypothetical protein
VGGSPGPVREGSAVEGSPMNTRTIAILALVIAVVVLILLVR